MSRPTTNDSPTDGATLCRSVDISPASVMSGADQPVFLGQCEKRLPDGKYSTADGLALLGSFRRNRVNKLGAR